MTATPPPAPVPQQNQNSDEQDINGATKACVTIPGTIATSATNLPFGFCRGTNPQKWLSRWQAAGYSVKLTATALDLLFFEDATKSPDTHTALTAVLTQGGVCLVRTPSDKRPKILAGELLHSVRLYDEETAVLCAKDSAVSSLKQLTCAADLEFLTLLDHPWHLPGYPAAQTWENPSWMPQTGAQLAQIVATNAGEALLPLPLARHLAGKQQHKVLPATALTGLPQTTVWAIWLQRADSPMVQDLVGVLRGRRSGSARVITQTKLTTKGRAAHPNSQGSHQHRREAGASHNKTTSSHSKAANKHSKAVNRQSKATNPQSKTANTQNKQTNAQSKTAKPQKAAARSKRSGQAAKRSRAARRTR